VNLQQLALALLAFLQLFFSLFKEKADQADTSGCFILSFFEKQTRPIFLHKAFALGGFLFFNFESLRKWGCIKQPLDFILGD